MFDHMGYNVRDFAVSKAFYIAALAPLGLKITHEGEGWAIIGNNPTNGLWFGALGEPASPIHIAFAASTRAEVDAFYKAALAAGGRDNGPPGLRPQYHANYHGAFVFDPDGHNIEAVCHHPE